jgi:oxidase EvaA
MISQEKKIKESSFLLSALTDTGQLQTLDDIFSWIDSRKKANQFKVEQILFHQMDDWHFEESTENLVHKSGKFFRIGGIRVSLEKGQYVEWDQPIIVQPEVGILGIITKKIDGIRHFLIQAKMEPGNINTIQLSPTFQATKSNYTRAHGGKMPLYAEYFLNERKSKILLNQLQGEHGSRFLKKRNLNMIIEVDEEIPVYEDFCWLTLGQIKKLSQRDNLVNMDTRSVLSCIPFIDRNLKGYSDSFFCQKFFKKELFDITPDVFKRDLFISMIDKKNTQHTLNEIINWFTEMKANCGLNTKDIPLKDVHNWRITDSEIAHQSGQFFSIIAVSIQASNREVTRWTQPLIRHNGYGLVGFLVKKNKKIIHFLVQAKIEPGSSHLVEMTSTVACSNAERRMNQPHKPLFLDIFMNAQANKIKYSCFQSDEGGRFFESQNRYVIVELEPSVNFKTPDTYMWMTLGQIMELIDRSYFSVNARGLISCLNFI